MTNLCYNVTDYQKYLWKYRKMVDSRVEAAEEAGKAQYEAFPSFADEVFHRMYAEEPQRLEIPAPGSEPFQKLHAEMDKIPELADLAERCKGDEEWAGISTSAMLDTLLATKAIATEHKVEDPAEDLAAMAEMKKLLERTPEAEQESIQQAIDELQAVADSKVQNAAQAAQMLDDSSVRQAVRKACVEAQKAISEQEAAYEAFGAGTELHSGKTRKAACREVAEALRDNSRLREIVKLAGRLRRIAMEKQRQKPRKGTDEVTGIELGDNLSRMIPVEALYTDPDCEVIFAKKFLEKTLQQVELNQVPPKEQGPVVVLLDSSGSMKLDCADIWAAAVALALFEIARKQKRAFALLHFGTTVLRTDMWEKGQEVSATDLTNAISFFASAGGTNFESPLGSAVEVIEKNKNFKDADIIMITDGQAGVGDAWLSAFKARKDYDNFKVYSMLIKGREDVAEKFSDEVVQLDEVLKDDAKMHEVFSKI